MIKKLKIIGIVILSNLSVSFADSIEAPNYNEIFLQQLKCNTKYFSSPIWEKKSPLLAKMNSGTIAVISKPVVTELPQKVYENVHPDYKNRKERNYKVNSTLYFNFTCGIKDQPKLANLNGTSVETLIYILETKVNTGTFKIIGGEAGDYLGTDPKINTNFLYYADDNESEVGMYCVVLVDDFLKNPNAINVDKLCEGKSVKDREATKKYIEKVRQALKVSDVDKTK